jgi:hypothetical protein
MTDAGVSYSGSDISILAIYGPTKSSNFAAYRSMRISNAKISTHLPISQRYLTNHWSHEHKIWYGHRLQTFLETRPMIPNVGLRQHFETRDGVKLRRLYLTILKLPQSVLS